MSGAVEESWTRVVHLPDGRWQVTVSLGGSPLHATLVLEEQTQGGARRLVCTQVVIEPTDGTGADAINGAGLRETAKNFEQIQQVAVAAVGAHPEGTGTRLAPGVRGRRELSPSFLRDVVRRRDEYKARRAVAHCLTRSRGAGERADGSALAVRAREAGIEGAS